MPAYVSSIGTAVPRYRHSQQDILTFMTQSHGLEGKDARKLAVLYRASGIAYRYSVLPDFSSSEKRLFSSDASPSNAPSTAKRQEIFKQEAPLLAARSARSCLEKGEINPREITHLIAISCTGMYAPGLDIDLIHELELDPGVSRTAINFMGCYAALVGMRTAADIARHNPQARVLVVCVELCSLHFQHQPTDDNLLANALFGDGAAAFLVEGERRSQTYPLEIVRFENTVIKEGDRDMAWNIGDTGFEMRLSSYVPHILADHILNFMRKAYHLSDPVSAQEVGTAYDEGNFQHYAIHPGGKRILQSVEKALGRGREMNHFAYDVLRDYGNMSSPTVMFVLNELWESQQLQSGQDVLMMAFGPGLTVESSLLAVC